MASCSLLLNIFLLCGYRISKQSDFWSASPHGAKTWVFCGSALSSMDLVGSNFPQKNCLAKCYNFMGELLFICYTFVSSQSHAVAQSRCNLKTGCADKTDFEEETYLLTVK